MASLNKVILIGNLTRDPEKKQLPSGQVTTRLGLAINRQFKNKQTGQMTQEVCFIDVDVWGAQAESAHQYLAKGRMVLVEGRLKLDSWQDQAGQPRSKHSIVAERIVFLGGNQPAAGDQSMDADAFSDFAAELDDKPAAKKTVKKASPKAAGENDFSFKNEPAFEDELPF
jgi:single-strand DNA-binding protein